jgi:hypothetical protein
MNKIFIKITEVDQRSRSIVVKFASKNSTKPIDEYDGLAFNIANFTSVTPAEFIESIRPQLSSLVAIRDQSEKVVETIDLSEWVNYSTTVDAIEIFNVDPAISAQILTGLSNPEVTL